MVCESVKILALGLVGFLWVGVCGFFPLLMCTIYARSYILAQCPLCSSAEGDVTWKKRGKVADNRAADMEDSGASEGMTMRASPFISCACRFPLVNVVYMYRPLVPQASPVFPSALVYVGSRLSR